MIRLSLNPTIWGVLAIIMWATMFVLVVLSGEIPPLLLGFITFGIGFLTMTAGKLATGTDIIAAYRRPWQDYLYGVGGIGGYTATLYFAFKNAPAFEVSVINYLWPILLALMVSFYDRAPLLKIQLLGLFMGFCGTVILFMPEPGHAFFESIKSGHIAALLAAFLWATYSTFARTKTYPFGFLGPVFLSSSLLCLVLHFIFEKTYWPHDALAWVAIVILGVFRISYAFWEYGLKHGDRQLIVSLSNLIPLLATLLLILGGFGPGRISVAVAGVFVIGGCLLVNHSRIARLIGRFS